MEKVYTKVLDISLKDEHKTEKVISALNNKTRRRILRLLASGPRSIANIAFELDAPISTVSEHISILIKSGIVSVIKQASDRGQSKVISRQYEKVDITIAEDQIVGNKITYSVEIPIGSYSAFAIDQYCGILGVDGYIGARDNPNAFYSFDRFKAQLLWFHQGYLEYCIPVDSKHLENMASLSFSLEVCSEAPGFNEEWKSDIYFEINGVYIGYFTSPGDFGARQGLLTPSWWSNDCTQYGLLKVLNINESGSYVDGVKISDVTVDSLNIKKQGLVKFRIGVSDKAQNKGGINLFGSKFGDYHQDILMTIAGK